MEIKITKRHEEDINKEQEIAITQHLEDLTKKFNRIESIEIILDKSRREHHISHNVEILVNCEHNHDIIANAGHENLMYAVNACCLKAKRLISDYKEQIQDHK